ncbi:MAG: transporter substrate-binding domain-containing protein [Desulfobacula sp.]|nr:transporter substrate-binding domain-containing protein [Desulfobacula sp.]
MHRVIVMLCMLFVLPFTTPVFAGDYTIASFPIPLMVESPDKGIFIEVTKEIAKRSGLDIEIKIFPTKRTVINFHENKVDGFFPALDVMINKDISPSEEMYFKKDFVFVKEGSSPVSTIEGLAGKKVGITMGYPYAKKITDAQGFTIEVAPNDMVNIKKLAAGRIDVFIVEEKSGLQALKESGVSGITYEAGKPISKQKVYYAFQPDAKGKEVAAKFSQALSSMKKDGTFGKIMSKASQ